MLDAETLIPANFNVTSTETSSPVEVTAIQYFPLDGRVSIKLSDVANRAESEYDVTSTGVKTVEGQLLDMSQRTYLQKQFEATMYSLSILSVNYIHNGKYTHFVPTEGDYSIVTELVNSGREDRVADLIYYYSDSDGSEVVLKSKRINIIPGQIVTETYYVEEQYGKVSVKLK